MRIIKIYLFDFDLDLMTLVFKHDLDIVKMYILKMKFLASVVQKLYRLGMVNLKSFVGKDFLQI